MVYREADSGGVSAEGGVNIMITLIGGIAAFLFLCNALSALVTGRWFTSLFSIMCVVALVLLLQL